MFGGSAVHYPHMKRRKAQQDVGIDVSAGQQALLNKWLSSGSAGRGIPNALRKGVKFVIADAMRRIRANQPPLPESPCPGVCERHRHWPAALLVARECVARMALMESPPAWRRGRPWDAFGVPLCSGGAWEYVLACFWMGADRSAVRLAPKPVASMGNRALCGPPLSKLLPLLGRQVDSGRGGGEDAGVVGDGDADFVACSGGQTRNVARAARREDEAGWRHHSHNARRGRRGRAIQRENAFGGKGQGSDEPQSDDEPIAAVCMRLKAERGSSNSTMKRPM